MDLHITQKLMLLFWTNTKRTGTYGPVTIVSYVLVYSLATRMVPISFKLIMLETKYINSGMSFFAVHT